MKVPMTGSLDFAAPRARIEIIMILFILRSYMIIEIKKFLRAVHQEGSCSLF